MQNLVHRWGWEVLAHPPYSPDLAPMWLLVVFTCKKTASGKTISIGRPYQHCCHCLLKACDQGWIQSCNWSFTM
jgi:hypothetical protein